MRRTILAALAAATILAPDAAAVAASSVTLGVVADGPQERAMLRRDFILTEARNVLGTTLDIRIPDEKRLEGGWTRAGIRAALDRLLADPEVDVVLALGLVASYEAAHRESLPKPVIAPIVTDPVLQGYPLKDGRSGRHNFVYVASFQGVADEIRMFQRVVRFRHVAVLIDRLPLETMPELDMKAQRLAEELGVRATLVPVTTSVDEAVAALPADADAVYVAPLMRLNEADMEELARKLIERRLPSFSLLGRRELMAGLLLSVSGDREEDQRLARRIALDLQRIVAGEDAANIEVGFPVQHRLAINMRTARAIGFSPRWQDLTDAEQYFAEETAALPTLSLIEAMQTALAANPDLRVSQLDSAIAGEDVRSSRSILLPQLEAGASATQIDDDRANALFQAEKTTGVDAQLSQLIYSESAWAGLKISKQLQLASDERYRQAVLDTLDAASTAYLNLLRARSLESVRRANVENTRTNLETSRVREAVGLTQRSEYLRWVTQINVDRQDLLAAEADRRQAETDLARILHRPASQPFTTVETGLDEPMALVSDARTQAYIDTPASWAIFQEFSVADALAHAPELKSVDATIVAQDRAARSAQRAFYLPELSLRAIGSDALERSGVGSESGPGFPDDQAWNVSLQARLPILTGGARRADYARARYGLRQLEAERESIADGVEARTRAALHRTASSFPAIDLSQQAAAAARENLAMVRDAYAKGAVSVTDLVDAQDASLEAELGAAEAKYTFLIDFIAVLRATGNFDILLDPASRQGWFGRVDAYFREHAGGPAAR
jgi:outer membrane protein TolC